MVGARDARGVHAVAGQVHDGVGAQAVAGELRGKRDLLAKLRQRDGNHALGSAVGNLHGAGLIKALVGDGGKADEGLPKAEDVHV